MGTNQRRKETNSTSNTGSIVDKQEQRFQWWRLIVGAAAVLVAALIPLLWESLKIDPPRFVLLNPITRPDSGITVVAQNRIAGRQMTLNIEFDGFLFVEAGRLIMSSYPQHWHFSIKDRNLPDSLMHDGIHHVRVGFAGMPLSEQLNLIFHTQKPVVEARVVQPPGREKDRIVTGRVASKLQVPSETLRVDIIFHYEGHPHQIPVPVKRVVDEYTTYLF